MWDMCFVIKNLRNKKFLVNNHLGFLPWCACTHRGLGSSISSVFSISGHLLPVSMPRNPRFPFPWFFHDLLTFKKKAKDVERCVRKTSAHSLDITPLSFAYRISIHAYSFVLNLARGQYKLKLVLTTKLMFAVYSNY